MTNVLPRRLRRAAISVWILAAAIYAPVTSAQIQDAGDAAIAAGFDTTATPTPVVLTAPAGPDPLALAVKAAKFDPTASTLTAPLPAAVVAAEAGVEDGSFNGQVTLQQFDLGDPDLLINLGVSGKITSGEAPIFSLSGFENAARVKLNAQLWQWDVGVEVDPATGRARSEILKEEYTRRFSSFSQDVANDFETQVEDSLQAIRTKLASAPAGPQRDTLLAREAFTSDFLARYYQTYEDPTPLFGGLQVEYGRQDFKVADLEAFGSGGAFATSTEQTAGYAAQFSFGALFGPGFALVHLRAERGYDAGPLTELSVLLDSTDTASRAFRQEKVYLKAPEREDRAILSVEYRYYPAGLNGRLAIAPRLNCRPYVSGDGDKQTSLELPLIFFPDKDGNLVGGFKAAWRLDEKAFGVRAFIGAKFDFFRP